MRKIFSLIKNIAGGIAIFGWIIPLTSLLIFLMPSDIQKEYIKEPVANIIKKVSGRRQQAIENKKNKFSCNDINVLNNMYK